MNKITFEDLLSSGNNVTVGDPPLELDFGTALKIFLEQFDSDKLKLDVLIKLRFEIKKRYIIGFVWHDVPEASDAVSSFKNMLNSWLENKLKVLEIFIEFYSSTKGQYKREGFAFSFDNNFNNLDSDDVYHYFYDKMVVSNLIDSETLNEFLILAFNKLETPQVKFKLSDNHGKTKTYIRRIFHEFYKKDPFGYKNQVKYAGLLGEYFEGFTTKSVKDNFSK